jgi:hypothetical protein
VTADQNFRDIMLGMCKIALGEIAECDAKEPPDYERRYHAVLMAMYWAAAGGLRTGIRIDTADPEWPVVYIELPTGQVSWHMPQHPIEWDGHDTATKYERISAWEPDVFERPRDCGEEPQTVAI